MGIASRRRSITCLLICILASGLALISFAFDAVSARAQASTIAIPVALAPVSRDTPVELTAVTLDANLTESDGHTLIAGYTTFKLHNTDVMNDVQIPVGLPTWAGDPSVFDPAQLGGLAVTIDGKKVTPALTRADLKVGSVVRSVDWYTFTLTLAPDEKKTVRYDFQQDLGDGAMPRFTYGLVTGSGWKGSIGSARLTVNFPQNTTQEQIVAYEPSNITFDGGSITWNFISHEPPANPVLTVVRPSLWSELANRRRAAAASPNDAGARAALGNLLRQLALLDSPRRDTYYAQAVAELETATRIDPRQRSARQSLALLYEMEAGPAAGPRQTAYVLLAAAQWEALVAGDAGAIKPLAEDYFYLALDAQTREAFAEAQAYYDKAQALVPGGAGPLFTPERMAAQRRALNLAWSRARLAQDDYAGAAAQARLALGDAFLASFSAPPFYVSRAEVTTAGNSRTLVFRLVPFTASAADLAKSVEGAMEGLRAAGAGVTVDVASPDVVLTIFAPLPQADWNILGDALPERAEWSFVRAVLVPRALDWEPGAGFLARSRYHEEVNLAPACAAFQAQAASIAALSKPLDSAPVTDAEQQLKRALLQKASSGWQRALGQGRAIYRVGDGETSVEPCGTRAIDADASPLRAEVILAGAMTVLLAVLVVLLILLSKLTRRGRSDP